MVVDEKQTFRSRVKALAAEKNDVWRISHSALIMGNLEKLPEFVNACTVALYWSLSDEVATHDFVKRWSSFKRVVLPCVCGEDIIFKELAADGEIISGKMGIGEPFAADIIAIDQIDLFVVPGVAFDIEGHRLGRGRGFYDRALVSAGAAFKVGVCFDYQLFDYVPCQAHDVKMDMVIHN